VDGGAFAATGLAAHERNNAAEELDYGVSGWQVTLVAAQAFHDVDNADPPVDGGQSCVSGAEHQRARQGQQEPVEVRESLESLAVTTQQPVAEDVLDEGPKDEDHHTGEKARANGEQHQLRQRVDLREPAAEQFRLDVVE
jgi:hypothetical protein